MSRGKAAAFARVLVLVLASCVLGLLAGCGDDDGGGERRGQVGVDPVPMPAQPALIARALPPPPAAAARARPTGPDSPRSPTPAHRPAREPTPANRDSRPPGPAPPYHQLLARPPVDRHRGVGLAVRVDSDSDHFDPSSIALDGSPADSTLLGRLSHTPIKPRWPSSDAAGDMTAVPSAANGDRQVQRQPAAHSPRRTGPGRSGCSSRPRAQPSAPRSSPASATPAPDGSPWSTRAQEAFRRRARASDVPLFNEHRALSRRGRTRSPRSMHASSCANHDPLKASLQLTSIVGNLVDDSAPAAAVTKGDLLSGWRRGTGHLTLTASDNVGITADRLRESWNTRRSWTPRWPDRTHSAIPSESLLDQP
jgi:hypothetical protein